MRLLSLGLDIAGRGEPFLWAKFSGMKFRANSASDVGTATTVGVARSSTKSLNVRIRIQDER